MENNAKEKIEENKTDTTGWRRDEEVKGMTEREQLWP